MAKPEKKTKRISKQKTEGVTVGPTEVATQTTPSLARPLETEQYSSLGLPIPPQIPNNIEVEGYDSDFETSLSSSVSSTSTLSTKLDSEGVRVLAAFGDEEMPCTPPRQVTQCVYSVVPGAPQRPMRHTTETTSPEGTPDNRAMSVDSSSPSTGLTPYMRAARINQPPPQSDSSDMDMSPTQNRSSGMGRSPTRNSRFHNVIWEEINRRCSNEKRLRQTQKGKNNPGTKPTSKAQRRETIRKAYRVGASQ